MARRGGGPKRVVWSAGSFGDFLGAGYYALLQLNKAGAQRAAAASQHSRTEPRANRHTSQAAPTSSRGCEPALPRFDVRMRAAPRRNRGGASFRPLPEPQESGGRAVGSQANEEEPGHGERGQERSHADPKHHRNHTTTEHTPPEPAKTTSASQPSRRS